MNVDPARTGRRRPWQNGIAERFFAAVRRELLDRVIVPGGRHLRPLVGQFLDDYHLDRTHLGLAKDSPSGRSLEPRTADDAGGGVRARLEATRNRSREARPSGSSPPPPLR